jgi:Na+/citrate or Na+/malate symporter
VVAVITTLKLSRLALNAAAVEVANIHVCLIPQQKIPEEIIAHGTKITLRHAVATMILISLLTLNAVNVVKDQLNHLANNLTNLLANHLTILLMNNLTGLLMPLVVTIKEVPHQLHSALTTSLLE